MNFTHEYLNQLATGFGLSVTDVLDTLAPGSVLDQWTASVACPSCHRTRTYTLRRLCTGTSASRCDCGGQLDLAMLLADQRDMMRGGAGPFRVLKRCTKRNGHGERN